MAREPADGASVPDFRESLSKLLGRAEGLALQEVERLNKALEAARAENEWLRSRLPSGATSPPGDLDDQDAAVPPRSDTDIEDKTVQPAPASAPIGPGPDQDQSAVREMVVHLNRSPSSMAHFHDSGWVADLVKSPYFEYATLFAVVLNAVWIAIDVDFNGKSLLESPPFFQAIEHIFVVLFALEMTLRFLAFKRKRVALWDAWFLFDALLVILMLIETWVFSIISLISGGSAVSGFGNASILRIVRLLRVARVMQIFAIVPELKMLIEGMFAGLRSVLSASCILASLTYTFAILLRQLGASTDWGKASFYNVPVAVYTLLIESILPDNASLLNEIASETWYCGVVYFTFLLLTAITLMNMLLGILCDVVFRVSQDEQERHGIEAMGGKLKAVLRTIDKDFDGRVSKTEFKGIITNKKALKALYDVGVDVAALVNDADFIFSDRPAGLPFDEFRDEVLKFRSSSSASNGTVAATRRFLRVSLLQLDEKLSRVEALVTTNRATPV